MFLGPNLDGGDCVVELGAVLETNVYSCTDLGYVLMVNSKTEPFSKAYTLL